MKSNVAFHEDMQHFQGANTSRITHRKLK